MENVKGEHEEHELKIICFSYIEIFIQQPSLASTISFIPNFHV